jgi:hypothetical protein
LCFVKIGPELGRPGNSLLVNVGPRGENTDELCDQAVAVAEQVLENIN